MTKLLSKHYIFFEDNLIILTHISIKSMIYQFCQLIDSNNLSSQIIKKNAVNEDKKINIFPAVSDVIVEHLPPGQNEQTD